MPQSWHEKQYLLEFTEFKIYGPRKLYIDLNHDTVYFGSHTFVSSHVLLYGNAQCLIPGLTVGDRNKLRHIAINYESFGLHIGKCERNFYENQSHMDKAQLAVSAAMKPLNETFPNLEMLTLVLSF